MNRKLSDTERVVWLVDRTDTQLQEAQRSTRNLNTGAVARIAGRVDEQLVRTALNWLHRRHATLKMRVDIAGGRPPVASDAEAIPPIPLRVETRQGNDHWEAEALYEMNHALPWSRGSLLTVVLLTSDEVSDIVVCLHHVMNDAASVLYLTRDLLGLLTQAVKGARTPILQAYPERRVLDDLPLGQSKIMGSLMKTTASMAAQVTHVLQQREQKMSKRNPPRHALPKPAALKRGDALHQTGCARMLHYVLSVEETALLANKCKEENTTTHGALCAAVLRAAGQHICASSTQNGAAVPINCLSAPRLCRALPAGTGLEIGLFVPMVTAAHYISKRARFWDVARHTETTVQDAVRQDDPLMALPLPREIAQRVSAPYSGMILVTNVGRLGIPNPYGAIVPHETKAAAGMTMADCFGVVVNQLPNRLMLSFFYPDTALSEDKVGLLGASVIKLLREAISAE